MDDDADLEAMQARVAAMEKEAADLKALKTDLESKTAPPEGTAEAEAEVPEEEDGALAAAAAAAEAAVDTSATDETSIYVGQVDYDATIDEPL